MKYAFSEEDKKFFTAHGISEEEIHRQLELYQRGSTYVSLNRAATIGDGIQQYDEKEIDHYVAVFDKKMTTYSLIRFIPASGMATRMFKFLHYFISKYKPSNETLRSYLNREKTYKLGVFFGGIEKFPFFKSIRKTISNKVKEDLSIDYRYAFIQKLLHQFSTKPKALIPFHHYGSDIRTAAEEQLYLSKELAEINQEIRIHFTIPPQTQDAFKQTLTPAIAQLEEACAVKTKLDFSVQKKSTDTIAVQADNTPYRDNSGALLLRAAGHGALIENLNKLDEQLIFLSNIDNISTEKYHQQTARYKKMLAGVLISRLEQVYQYCHALAENEEVDLIEVSSFMKEQLHITIPEDLSGEGLIAYMQQKLNRPLRVCGMVKNEGEPGGGPFWVEKNGVLSLQIVESAQVDSTNKEQEKKFKKGTHFNPVDIVCATHDYLGNKYDLTKFVDKESYFIADKSVGDTKIKALERPGLWNGAMADWNTIFVEVPLRTFNPVKNLNDLLRPMHQPN